MKKVCVVTGSRADYGLLRGVMARLQVSPTCKLQVIVTGMHLANEFGQTWSTIESDGFSIDWKVEMLLGSDTEVGVSKSVGLAMLGFSDAYEHLRPDLVLLLGDRFEIFAAASSAIIAGIPIAHLHGGEITSGSLDDTLRHCITKMADLHFTAAEIYRQRVIQMGENPDKVWCVGGFGVDAALGVELLEPEELQTQLGMSLEGNVLLITFHPETGKLVSSVEKQMSELLSALKVVDAQLIFTMPNADVGGRVLFEMVRSFVEANPAKSCVHTSLGQVAYLSTMALCSGVVGNSSSGIIEAPSFGVGTVNIGARQDGRLKAESVIDCVAERRAILEALDLLLLPETKARNRAGVKNPYGEGGASAAVVSVIERWHADEKNKIFHDLGKGALEARRVCG